MCKSQNRRSFVSLSVLALWFLWSGFVGSPEALPRDRIRVATGGYSPTIPPYVSFAAPFFQRQELDIESILMNSGSLSGQALARRAR